MIEGVFMTHGHDEQWTLSVQHADEDVQRDIDSFETFARELTGRAGGGTGGRGPRPASATSPRTSRRAEPQPGAPWPGHGRLAAP